MYRIIIYFVCFFLITTIVTAQAIKEESHLQHLQDYRNKADGYFAKKLNRFGLDQLRQYDKTLDVFFQKEKEDTLAAIENYFDKAGAVMHTEQESLLEKKAILLKNKTGYNNSYQEIITRISLFVVALAVLFLVILVIWKRKLTKQQQLNELFKLKLAKSQSMAYAGESLIASSGKKLVVYQELKLLLNEFHQEEEKLQKTFIGERKNETWQDIWIYIKNINQQLNTETSRNNTILEYAKSNVEEKIPTDMNKLCTAYFDLVKDGIQTEEEMPEIKSSTDLEKNLPQIKIIPSAIGHLLIHVLTNAIHSVQAKARKAKKGYEPKISLSTRILPRFLQIRVHDNGAGIEDKYFNQIKDAFFTLKEEEDAGLGLYISNLIMKNHHGEIKIESDKNTGTDVYLKFFIS